ncbi:MAG: hypothetical protein KatS3mg029_0624 [Saprospiraceae bacterium]|nr:MAG: hypothetical protein KatS3mg029_0624 [Saprospiraceae bacterium]
MLGFFKPRQYFHIALYEYARVFRRVHPEKPWPQWQESDWDTLQTISGMRREAIEKWIGLPDIDIDAVAVVHFFVFPERFQRLLPERFATLRDIFFPRQTCPAAIGRAEGPKPRPAERIGSAQTAIQTSICRSYR